MGTVRIVAVSAILATGLLQAGGASAHPHDVKIMRGGQPASIAESRDANVRVFRGTPTATLAAFDGELREATPIVEAVSAGSKIWFVDRVAGKLSVCRLASTTQVGEHRIDCHSRAIPR